MMTQDRWADALRTPTSLWFVNSSKSSLLLEQKPPPFISVFDDQLLYAQGNIEAASILARRNPETIFKAFHAMDDVFSEAETDFANKILDTIDDGRKE